jgi:hypothetical protein
VKQFDPELSQDVSDLIACGKPAYFPYNKLFYALKDAILETYGEHDGVDEQVWDDYCDDYDDGELGYKEVYASHHHILDRYIYGGHVFHIPTNEFLYYRNYGFVEKRSTNFDALCGQAKNRMQGKKQKDWSNKAQKEAWVRLKRLVRRHGKLLREPQMIMA